MKASVVIIAIANMVIAVVTWLLRWLQFGEARPFDNVYAWLSALSLVAFLLTWAYVAVAIVVLWSIGERIRTRWLYLWTMTSAVYIMWFCMGLIKVLLA